MSYQCSITISWEPADGQADAYRVYFREAGTDTTDPEEFQLLDVVYASQDLTYTLEDLDPDTEYEFAVKTITSGELNEISKEAAIKLSTGAIVWARFILVCQEFKGSANVEMIKYIECYNFWTINAKYIIVYIFERKSVKESIFGIKFD